jgi:putative ABC transport system permease protein
MLVVVMLALGVATVALTLLIARELKTRLTRDAEGIDLVVGAKGSPLQIVLAGVYHADVPPGNIPLSAVTALRRNPLVAQVIPWRRRQLPRISHVGTEPELVAHYGGVLEAGELWSLPLDAVLGSDVARAAKLRAGDKFTGSHGLVEGGGQHADARYSVTGVLAPTGTVLDRLVLTSLASVWTVHEHRGEDDANARREVTLALVKYRTPLAAASLPRASTATRHWSPHRRRMKPRAC